MFLGKMLKLILHKAKEKNIIETKGLLLYMLMIKFNTYQK